MKIINSSIVFILCFLLLIGGISSGFAYSEPETQSEPDRVQELLDVLILQGYGLQPDGTIFTAREFSGQDRNRFEPAPDPEDREGIYSTVFYDFDEDGDTELFAVIGDTIEQDGRKSLAFKMAMVDGSDHSLYINDKTIYGPDAYLHEDEGNPRSFIAVQGKYIITIDRFDYEENHVRYTVYAYSGEQDPDAPEDLPAFRQVAELDYAYSSLGGYPYYSVNHKQIKPEDKADVLEGFVTEYGLEDLLFPVYVNTGEVVPDKDLRAGSTFYWFGDYDNKTYTKAINVRDNGGSYIEYSDGLTIDTGDVNGNGNVLADDARLALRASAQLEFLSGWQLLAADVDGDGKVVAADARKILRVSADLDSFEEPSSEPASGSEQASEPESGSTVGKRGLIDKLANRNWTLFYAPYPYSELRSCKNIDFSSDGSSDALSQDGVSLRWSRDDELIYRDKHGMVEDHIIDIQSDSMIEFFACTVVNSYGILVPTEELSESNDLTDRFRNTVWNTESFGVNINLGENFTLYPVSTNVICGISGDQCVFLEPDEDSCLAVVITGFDTGTTYEESVSVETWTRVPDSADWRPAAKRFFENYETPSGGSNADFALMDISGDSIPEIIFYYGEWEVYYVSEVYVWDGSSFSEAYSYDYRGLALQDINAYANKDTGDVEFWDLGRMDLTAEDLPGALDPMVGVADMNLVRIELADGKIRAAESHDELLRLADADLSQEQLQERLDALRDFHDSFFGSHEEYDIKSIKVRSKPESTVIDVDALKDMVDAW